MNLSTHFTLHEALFSSTAGRFGIDNSHPTEAIIEEALSTASMMERVRLILGEIPLHIDSWIRCLELNRALRSKDTSQHILGSAVDFICPTYGTPLVIAQKLIDNTAYIDFDQLIYEHDWIHISHDSKIGIQRHDVLTLTLDGKYASGLHQK